MKRTLIKQSVTAGDVLLHDFMTPLGISQERLAQHLLLDVMTVERIINGKIRMTPDLAMKLGTTLGTTTTFWTNLDQHVAKWKAYVNTNAPVMIASKIS